MDDNTQLNQSIDGLDELPTVTGSDANQYNTPPGVAGYDSTEDTPFPHIPQVDDLIDTQADTVIGGETMPTPIEEIVDLDSEPIVSNVVVEGAREFFRTIAGDFEATGKATEGWFKQVRENPISFAKKMFLSNPLTNFIYQKTAQFDQRILNNPEISDERKAELTKTLGIFKVFGQLGPNAGLAEMTKNWGQLAQSSLMTGAQIWMFIPGLQTAGMAILASNAVLRASASIINIAIDDDIEFWSGLSTGASGIALGAVLDFLPLTFGMQQIFYSGAAAISAGLIEDALVASGHLARLDTDADPLIVAKRQEILSKYITVFGSGMGIARWGNDIVEGFIAPFQDAYNPDQDLVTDLDSQTVETPGLHFDLNNDGEVTDAEIAQFQAQIVNTESVMATTPGFSIESEVIDNFDIDFNGREVDIRLAEDDTTLFFTHTAQDGRQEAFMIDGYDEATGFGRVYNVKGGEHFGFVIDGEVVSAAEANQMLADVAPPIIDVASQSAPRNEPVPYDPDGDSIVTEISGFGRNDNAVSYNEATNEYIIYNNSGEPGVSEPVVLQNVDLGPNGEIQSYELQGQTYVENPQGGFLLQTDIPQNNQPQPDQSNGPSQSGGGEAFDVASYRADQLESQGYVSLAEWSSNPENQIFNAGNVDLNDPDIYISAPNQGESDYGLSSGDDIGVMINTRTDEIHDIRYNDMGTGSDADDHQLIIGQRLNPNGGEFNLSTYAVGSNPESAQFNQEGGWRFESDQSTGEVSIISPTGNTVFQDVIPQGQSGFGAQAALGEINDVELNSMANSFDMQANDGSFDSEYEFRREFHVEYANEVNENIVEDFNSQQFFGTLDVIEDLRDDVDSIIADVNANGTQTQIRNAIGDLEQFRTEIVGNGFEVATEAGFVDLDAHTFATELPVGDLNANWINEINQALDAIDMTVNDFAEGGTLEFEDAILLDWLNEHNGFANPEALFEAFGREVTAADLARLAASGGLVGLTGLLLWNGTGNNRAERLGRVIGRRVPQSVRNRFPRIFGQPPAQAQQVRQQPDDETLVAANMNVTPDDLRNMMRQARINPVGLNLTPDQLDAARNGRNVDLTPEQVAALRNGGATIPTPQSRVRITGVTPLEDVDINAIRAAIITGGYGNLTPEQEAYLRAGGTDLESVGLTADAADLARKQMQRARDRRNPPPRRPITPFAVGSTYTNRETGVAGTITGFDTDNGLYTINEGGVERQVGRDYFIYSDPISPDDAAAFDEIDRDNPVNPVNPPQPLPGDVFNNILEVFGDNLNEQQVETINTYVQYFNDLEVEGNGDYQTRVAGMTLDLNAANTATLVNELLGFALAGNFTIPNATQDILFGDNLPLNEVVQILHADLVGQILTQRPMGTRRTLTTQLEGILAPYAQRVTSEPPPSNPRRPASPRPPTPPQPPRREPVEPNESAIIQEEDEVIDAEFEEIDIAKLDVINQNPNPNGPTDYILNTESLGEGLLQTFSNGTGEITIGEFGEDDTMEVRLVQPGYLILQGGGGIQIPGNPDMGIWALDHLDITDEQFEEIFGYDITTYQANYANSQNQELRDDDDTSIREREEDEENDLINSDEIGINNIINNEIPTVTGTGQFSTLLFRIGNRRNFDTIQGNLNAGQMASNIRNIAGGLNDAGIVELNKRIRAIDNKDVVRLYNLIYNFSQDWNNN